MAQGDHRTRDDAVVFVSSRIPSLREERKRIFERIKAKRKGYRVFVYEQVGSSVMKNEAFYLEAAADARVLVLLYTREISQPVIDEVRVAKKAGAKFLVFYALEVEHREMLEFLERESIEAKATQWQSKSHLVDLVVDSVADTISLGLETLTTPVVTRQILLDSIIAPPDADPAQHALFKSIGEFCTQGHYEKAQRVVESFEHSGTGAQHEHDALILRSYLMRRQHKWEEALDLATSAVQVSDTGRATLAVAVTLFMSGNEDAARVVASQLRTRSDIPVIAYSFLGRLALQAGDQREATRCVGALRPFRERYWFEFFGLLSHLHETLNEPKHAVRAMETLLKRSSDEAPLYQMNLASLYLDCINDFDPTFVKARAKELLQEVSANLAEGLYMHRESEEIIRDQLASTRAGLSLAEGNEQAAWAFLSEVPDDPERFPLASTNREFLQDRLSGSHRVNLKSMRELDVELPQVTYARLMTILEELPTGVEPSEDFHERISSLESAPGGRCYGRLARATQCIVMGRFRECLAILDLRLFRRSSIPVRSDALFRRLEAQMRLELTGDALHEAICNFEILTRSPTGFVVFIVNSWNRRLRWRGGYPYEDIFDLCCNVVRELKEHPVLGDAHLRDDAPWATFGESVARMARIANSLDRLAKLEVDIRQRFPGRIASKVMAGVGEGLL